MNKICVLIRVYNRTEDLKYCVDIIRDTWKLNQYYIIVVFNGREDGYSIDNDTLNKIDLLLEIKNNIGHFSGNSQLLLEGLNHIPEDCPFTIILEADTWVFGDTLVEKYISKLVRQSAVWASAQFFSYVPNLATDFAIVNTHYVKTHPEVFTFVKTPEYYVADYLKKNGQKFIYIKENMPVNLPKYIKSFPYAPTGRFFSFPDGKMVTHHVETLQNGMIEKKNQFNVVSNTNYFDVPVKQRYAFVRLKMRIAFLLSYIIPYKSWIVKK